MPFISSYGSNWVNNCSLCPLWFSLEKELESGCPGLPRSRVMLGIASQVRELGLSEALCFAFSSLPGDRGHCVHKDGKTWLVPSLGCFWVVAILCSSQKLCDKPASESMPCLNAENLESDRFLFVCILANRLLNRAASSREDQAQPLSGAGIPLE